MFYDDINYLINAIKYNNNNNNSDDNYTHTISPTQITFSHGMMRMSFSLYYSLPYTAQLA